MVLVGTLRPPVIATKPPSPVAPAPPPPFWTGATSAAEVRERYQEMIESGEYVEYKEKGGAVLVPYGMPRPGYAGPPPTTPTLTPPPATPTPARPTTGTSAIPTQRFGGKSAVLPAHVLEARKRVRQPGEREPPPADIAYRYRGMGKAPLPYTTRTFPSEIMPPGATQKQLSRAEQAAMARAKYLVTKTPGYERMTSIEKNVTYERIFWEEKERRGVFRPKQPKPVEDIDSEIVYVQAPGKDRTKIVRMTRGDLRYINSQIGTAGTRLKTIKSYKTRGPALEKKYTSARASGAKYVYEVHTIESWNKAVEAERLKVRLSGAGIPLGVSALPQYKPERFTGVGYGPTGAPYSVIYPKELAKLKYRPTPKQQAPYSPSEYIYELVGGKEAVPATWTGGSEFIFQPPVGPLGTPVPDFGFSIPIPEGYEHRLVRPKRGPGDVIPDYAILSDIYREQVMKQWERAPWGVRQQMIESGMVEPYASYYTKPTAPLLPIVDTTQWDKTLETVKGVFAPISKTLELTAGGVEYHKTQGKRGRPNAIKYGLIPGAVMGGAALVALPEFATRYVLSTPARRTQMLFQMPIEMGKEIGRIGMLYGPAAAYAYSLAFFEIPAKASFE